MLGRFRPAFAAAIATTVLTAGIAVAATGGQKLIDSPMVGVPAGGPTLQGVIGGGAPWVLDEGHAQLRADGRLNVEVDHLVLVSTHTNPIPTAVAIVTCNGAPVATTGAVPYSSTGDAEIDTRVTLPATCFAPAVFFAGVTGNGPRWFAVNGG